MNEISSNSPQLVDVVGGLAKQIGRRPKVMVTKIGLDGHDRGSRLVAGFLRDAGMEVIYTAPWQEISHVVNQALEEDVDAIGISSLATDHLLMPKLMRALKDADMDDVVVVVGGIVPDPDLVMLKEAGVARVYHPGASRDDIVLSLSELIAEKVSVAEGTGND
jgi:methylmalonyl-CoA mutase C-terminal domain/subunit